MKTMNAAQADGALSDKVFEDSFSVWWPRLEKTLKQLPPPEIAVPKSRDPEIQDEDIRTSFEIYRLKTKHERRLYTAYYSMGFGWKKEKRTR